MDTENLGELFAALAAARLEFGTVTKGKTANIRSDKGASYAYSYADLAGIIEATANALAKHGLVVIQEPELVSDGSRQMVVIHGCIAHKSGGMYKLHPLPLPVTGNNAQAVGSAISYGRRYQLTAALNLAAADDDDDGQEAAQDATQKPHSATRTTQKGQSGSPVPKRTVDASTGEIDYGMGSKENPFDAGAPYFVKDANRLTGKAYDLVKWIATLHKKSDGPCTAKQYQYLVGIADDLSDNEHGYVLSVLCQSDITKANMPGAKVAEQLLDILPASWTEDGKKVDNSNYRADIAQIIRDIAKAAKKVEAA